MAYLYAGLGIAMLTGIMAMFEMASSYLQFQNTWAPASVANLSLYYDGLHLKDQYIMEAIKEDPDMDICNVEKTAEVMASFDLESYDFSKGDSDFVDGCSFQSSTHRIIFDSINGLWSCALPSSHVSKPSEKCDFEV